MRNFYFEKMKTIFLALDSINEIARFSRKWALNLFWLDFWSDSDIFCEFSNLKFESFKLTLKMYVIIRKLRNIRQKYEGLRSDSWDVAYIISIERVNSQRLDLHLFEILRQHFFFRIHLLHYRRFCFFALILDSLHII